MEFQPCEVASYSSIGLRQLLYFWRWAYVCRRKARWPTVSTGKASTGQNWNSTVESQFGGTCWDFSACGSIEAKYILTRNDPNFNPDVSEQQVCWETNPDMGSTGGGWGTAVLDYFTHPRRRFGDRMPLSIFEPRHRHRSLLALGHRLAKPRLEEHLESERFHQRHQHDEGLPEAVRPDGGRAFGQANDLYGSVADMENELPPAGSRRASTMKSRWSVTATTPTVPTRRILDHQE